RRLSSAWLMSSAARVSRSVSPGGRTLSGRYSWFSPTGARRRPVMVLTCPPRGSEAGRSVRIHDLDHDDGINGVDIDTAVLPSGYAGDGKITGGGNREELGVVHIGAGDGGARAASGQPPGMQERGMDRPGPVGGVDRAAGSGGRMDRPGPVGGVGRPAPERG